MQGEIENEEKFTYFDVKYTTVDTTVMYLWYL
jgi:hypothetical protein